MVYRKFHWLTDYQGVCYQQLFVGIDYLAAFSIYLRRVDIVSEETAFLAPEIQRVAELTTIQPSNEIGKHRIDTISCNAYFSHKSNISKSMLRQQIFLPYLHFYT